MGESPREQETNQLLGQIKGMNPNVANLFSNYKDPYGASDILKAVDAFTKSGIGRVQRDTATGIKRAGSGVARRFAGAGVTKGSIFEDAVAGAENNARVAGGNIISDLLQKQLGLTPGILEGENQRKFRTTQANQNVLFGNKANEFNKFGVQGNITQLLSDDTWFDDLLEILNTAGNIGTAFSKPK